MKNNPGEAARLLVELAKHTNNTPYTLFLLLKDRLVYQKKIEEKLLDMDE